MELDDLVFISPIVEEQLDASVDWADRVCVPNGIGV